MAVFPVALNHVLNRALAGLAASASTQPAGGATQPVGDELGLGGAILLGGMLVALVVALRVGVFQHRRVDGPLRVAPGRPIWPLLATMGAALVVWFGASSFYLGAKQAMAVQRAATEHPGSRPTTVGLVEPTLADFAFLTTVPETLAFFCLFAADRLLFRLIGLRLGFTAGRLRDGVAKGLLGLVMIMPLMLAGGAVIEKFYQSIQYKHPAEHQMLKLMGESPSPVLTGCLIAGALLVAPFFEEYFFRGYLQTLLRESFVRWSAAVRGGDAGGEVALSPIAPSVTPSDQALAPPAPPAPALPPPLWPVGRGLSYYGPPPGVAPAGRRVWETWTAIVITSIAFGLVHEFWSAPIIFVLALCLGYAYERTGSLWTTITIHFVFNATMTAIYLTNH